MSPAQATAAVATRDARSAGDGTAGDGVAARQHGSRCVLPCARVSPKARGVCVQLLAYAVATAAAWAIVTFVPLSDPLRTAALADAVATVVIFGCSVALSNSSMYDPYWSVAPPALFAYWLIEGEPSARAWIALALVVLWGARLTWNFVRGWPGLHHEDWRYVDLRAKSGAAYWLVSFLGIHLFPTVLTFVGSLSLYVVAASPARPLGVLDGVAALLTLGAVTIEAVADEQLRAHTRSNPPRGSICERGLWRHSRHPNYFGEIGVWWGLSLFALAADSSKLWVLAGPLSITALFAFISIPMIDRRMVARRPAYAEHMKRVSGLVPWFRRG